MPIKLSPLQETFYDYMRDDVDEINWEALKRDISTMNAAELRHNLKVFKENDDSYLKR